MQAQPKLANGVRGLAFSCPRCEYACLSTSYKSTLVGYAPKSGHDHDGNCRTFHFKCESCGQTFTVRPINTCPAEGCDYKSKADCRICGDAIQLWWKKGGVWEREGPSAD